MNLYHVLGAILLSTPVLFFLWTIVVRDGWRAMVFVLGFTIGFFSLVVLGAYLLTLP